ncbi:TonB family protein [Undibacterium cyanobacteriorum]|uniref:TonB family protein n=1 Tax=Undibacterium cyanobacteriorum TaxID=3073561 RepID=A0ABY9RFE3_9BURK|nr:TonB family protein [Undibacterium sp. 20NA77.5]WMW79350.1 TonB family protein [Undibacterium sp. 20NA77.5]
MNTFARFSLAFTTLSLAASFHAQAAEIVNPFTTNACSAPSYNEQLLREDVSGAVKLRFATDVRGKVVDARIEQSSGNRELDNASINALKSCKFESKIDSKVIVFNWKIV